MTELREEGGSTLESLLTLIASHTISRLDKTPTCNIKWWLWTEMRTIVCVFKTLIFSLLLWNWDLHVDSSPCPFETDNCLKKKGVHLGNIRLGYLRQILPDCTSVTHSTVCTCIFPWQVSFFWLVPIFEGFLFLVTLYNQTSVCRHR